jgi:hypothetical protein
VYKKLKTDLKTPCRTKLSCFRSFSSSILRLGVQFLELIWDMSFYCVLFFPLLFFVFANSQQPTANSQQPTANSQQPTANSQQPTANSQQPTANSQQVSVLAIIVESPQRNQFLLGARGLATESATLVLTPKINF